jgi:hypothetical protein
MQTVNVKVAATQPRPIKFISIAIILIILITAGIFLFSSLKTPSKLNAVVISQATLEEKYGLRVNLIAVTAAGGMVDLRLKILDGEKAKLLLQDKKNFPVLINSDGTITLNVSEDTKSQAIKFEDGFDLFLLFPNTGNAVKPGTAVKLMFGDTAIESINAR